MPSSWRRRAAAAIAAPPPMPAVPAIPLATGIDHAFFDLPYNHTGTLINDLPPTQGPTASGNLKALRPSPPPGEQTSTPTLVIG